jgi:hypothetical protein
MDRERRRKRRRLYVCFGRGGESVGERRNEWTRRDRELDVFCLVSFPDSDWFRTSRGSGRYREAGEGRRIRRGKKEGKRQVERGKSKVATEYNELAPDPPKEGREQVERKRRG